MGINNGQPVNASASNTAWLAANKDDTGQGKYSLVDAGSASITDIQNLANRTKDAAGVDEGSNDGTTYGAPANTIDDGDNHETALTKLANFFDGSLGHTHDGSDGNGPTLPGTSISGNPLRGSVINAVDLSTITGISTDVSAQFAAKTPSTSPTVQGVVVLPPNNKVVLRQATGLLTDDVFKDAAGDIVYGRLTEAASVWTLTYFVDKSGVETSHNFTGAVDIRWYYQELFNPLTNAPVFSEFANIPSDNATFDVIDATESVFGKVRLATNIEANTDVLQSQDSRLPTQDENNALVGTQGTPSTTNKYVTDEALLSQLGTEPKFPAKQSIGQGIAATDLTGFTWDKDNIQTVIGYFTITRRVAATEGRRSVVEFFAHYNQETAVWTVNFPQRSGTAGKSGVTFSFTDTAGVLQLRAATDTVPGGGAYTGFITGKTMLTFDTE